MKNSLGAFGEDDFVAVVHFAEADFDDLVARGLVGAADVSGFDGKLAMSAVNEDEQRDAARTALVENGVERGAGGASGVENVVHDDDVAAIDIEADGRGGNDGLFAMCGKVVTIIADVEAANVNRLLLQHGERFGNAPGQGNAAALNADKRGRRVFTGFFRDLVGEADERALNFRRGHEAQLFSRECSFEHRRLMIAECEYCVVVQLQAEL